MQIRQQFRRPTIHMEATMRTKLLALFILCITAALLAGCASDRVYYYQAYPAVSNVAPPLPQAPSGPVTAPSQAPNQPQAACSHPGQWIWNGAQWDCRQPTVVYVQQPYVVRTYPYGYGPGFYPGFGWGVVTGVIVGHRFRHR
jgi:hypothetical protein